MLDGIQGNAMEIVAEIDPKDAPMVELNVLRAPQKEEFTRIAFFRNRGFRDTFHSYESSISARRGRRSEFRTSLITIDSSYSSGAPDVLSRAPETAPVRIEADEILELRVFSIGAWLRSS